MTNQQIIMHYMRIASFWAGVSGANIEIVLHDFSKGDHSVVAIYNNELSGRKKGDGMTFWEQTKVRDMLNSGNQCEMNFRGLGVKGQSIRCSVLLIQDEEHKLLGALTASVDVTHFIEMADYYRVLAFLPEVEQKRILDNTEFIIYTSTTIRSRQELEKELAEIRSQGYAEDRGEAEIGLWCVAVPIFGQDGNPVGAISVAGPDIRMTDDIKRALIQRLRAFSLEISTQHLGFVPNN